MEVVVNDNDADTSNIDELSEQLNANAAEELTTGIEQSLRESLRTSIAGEMADIQRKQLAKHFTIADKKVLDGLSFPDMLKKVSELSGSKATQEVQKWQDDMNSLVESHQREIEQWEQKYNDNDKAWLTKYQGRDIDDRITQLTGKIPSRQGDLATQAKVLKLAAQAEGFDLRYNAEKQKVEFWKDGKQYVENSKTLDDEKYFNTLAEKSGFVVKNTSNITPSSVLGATGKIVEMPAQPIAAAPKGMEAIYNYVNQQG